MKKKKPFSSVERLLIAAIALCLAIAGAMGFLFFKVTCENREAEQELTLIEQPGTAHQPRPKRRSPRRRQS